MYPRFFAAFFDAEIGIILFLVLYFAADTADSILEIPENLKIRGSLRAFPDDMRYIRLFPFYNYLFILREIKGVAVKLLGFTLLDLKVRHPREKLMVPAPRSVLGERSARGKTQCECCNEATKSVGFDLHGHLQSVFCRHDDVRHVGSLSHFRINVGSLDFYPEL